MLWNDYVDTLMTCAVKQVTNLDESLPDLYQEEHCNLPSMHLRQTNVEVPQQNHKCLNNKEHVIEYNLSGYHDLIDMIRVQGALVTRIELKIDGTILFKSFTCGCIWNGPPDHFFLFEHAFPIYLLSFHTIRLFVYVNHLGVANMVKFPVHVYLDQIMLHPSCRRVPDFPLYFPECQRILSEGLLSFPSLRNMIAHRKTGRECAPWIFFRDHQRSTSQDSGEHKCHDETSRSQQNESNESNKFASTQTPQNHSEKESKVQIINSVVCETKGSSRLTLAEVFDDAQFKPVDQPSVQNETRHVEPDENNQQVVAAADQSLQLSSCLIM